MQYGFVIDHNSCIGCHACTVACKAENDVPLGRFRTSVKYVEQGRFPDIKRHFLVQRCNQCTDAPCVTICPVNALDKRPDGIVDVDRDACIGCKACMQACPYDAIYLNEDLGAVEKCHFCAHRIDNGLAPACEVVCPVGAIISGDLDDPSSRVAQLARQSGAKTRRPEQGTGPNVHYLGAAEVALEPGSASRPSMYLWSDRPPEKPDAWPVSLPVVEDATVVLDQGHRIEWGWPVAAYLLTKGVAAGVAMLAPWSVSLGLAGPAAGWVPEVLATVFLVATFVLLVGDLARPLLFYRLLTRPNLSSWLVKGGVILSLLGLLLATGIVARAAGGGVLAETLRWPTAALGVAAAGYTAFLFRQCKGRDLWESRLLLPHLIAQALLCGSVCLLPWAPASGGLKAIFIGASLAHALMAVIERVRSHQTANARQGAAFLTSIRLGPLSPWREGLLIGVGLSLVLVFVAPAIVFIPALAGLYLYEHAFVRAGQLPPLS
ncbi:MAG: 4Fe-4S dicluster domain-containing protein [Planctomycetes bacterium]|nr:4Fe-4S dicluster domain-containing protein [Planctomycetota bacterium]